MAKRIIITDEDLTGDEVIHTTRRALPMAIGGWAAGIWYLLNSAMAEATEVRDASIEIPDAITILHRSASEVAPEGITFAADPDSLELFGIPAPDGVVYDARLHELAYLWTFGDDYEFEAPEKGSFTSSGTAIGAKAAHVYRRPGTYTVKLDVWGFVDGDLTHAFSETSVTIADPDALFPGDQTLFVSAEEDWTHAPSGALQYSSLDEAAEYIATGWMGSGDLPHRLMINCGETYAFSGRGLAFNADETKTIHVVTAGTGAKPILNCTGGWSITANYDQGFADCDIVIQGLDMHGPYDSAIGNDPDNMPTAFQIGDNTTPQMVLIDGCTADGFGHGLFLLDVQAHTGIYANDTVVTNWSRWGAIGNTGVATCILGSRFSSAFDALVDNGSNAGAPMRLGGDGQNTLIQGCDFYSGQGWSEHGPIIATQPCMRLNGDAYPGAHVSVTRTAMEGGYNLLTIGATSVPTTPCNVVIESNYMVGSYQTVHFIGLDYGGATIRNNIMVMPDADRMEGTNSPASYVKFTINGADEENNNAPTKIVFNTLVDLTDSNMSVVSGVWTGARLVENNATLPGDEPMVTTPALWEPRETGYHSAMAGLQAQTSTPVDIVASYALAAGSPAIGDADEAFPLDYTGEFREAAASRGAQSRD